MENKSKNGGEGHDPILSEIKKLRKEVQAYRTSTQKELRDLFEKNIIDNIINPLFQQRLKDVDERMGNQLPQNCDLRDECAEEFHEFFESLFEENKQAEGNLKEIVKEKEEELKSLENSMPYEKCESCFETAFDLLNKESELISSVNPSIFPEEYKNNLESISGDNIVKNILIPLANKKRISIIMNLADGSMSFSEISNLTDLRGGNLLFHLKKLEEKNFIVQKHEGGDYWITEKGLDAISALISLFQSHD